MITLYEFLNKFSGEHFEIVSSSGKEMLVSHSIDFQDMKDAINYKETQEEKYIDYISEKAVLKVDFMTNTIYCED